MACALVAHYQNSQAHPPNHRRTSERMYLRNENCFCFTDRREFWWKVVKQESMFFEQLRSPLSANIFAVMKLHIRLFLLLCKPLWKASCKDILDIQTILIVLVWDASIFDLKMLIYTQWPKNRKRDYHGLTAAMPHEKYNLAGLCISFLEYFDVSMRARAISAENNFALGELRLSLNLLSKCSYSTAHLLN